MKRILGILAGVIVISGSGLMGCAPKISVLSSEDVKKIENTEKVQKEIDKVYREAYLKGYEDCRKEYYERLKAEYDMLIKRYGYNEYIRGGFVKPPVIAKVVNPPKVSEDGKSFSAPEIKFIILRDAVFEPRNLIERLLSHNYFIFLGIVYGEDEVRERRSVVEEFLKRECGISCEGKYEVEEVPVVDGKGVAVVLKTGDPYVRKKVIEELGGMEMTR